MGARYLFDTIFDVLLACAGVATMVVERKPG